MSLHLVSLTTLHPSPTQRGRGLFVERRLQSLRELGCQVDLVCPVREGPRGDDQFPPYRSEPWLGKFLAPWRIAKVSTALVAQSKSAGAQVLDAHYAWPDGVAAARVARTVGLPYCVTVRGTDVNHFANHWPFRRPIVRALNGAAVVFSVSDALAEQVRALGVTSPVRTVRNGVDTTLFYPDPAIAVEKGLLVGVGNLVPEKGWDLIIKALAQLPGCRLSLYGDGPLRASLMACARAAGVAERVEFHGRQSPAVIANAYRRAATVVLGSYREGTPNVLLEAMACGTPVVTTAVGGVREVVSAERGRTLATRSTSAFAAAVNDVLANAVPPQAISQGILELCNWQASARCIVGELHQALNVRAAA